MKYIKPAQTMAKNEIPRSINLLEPVNPPEDLWEKMYDWLFNVGKYLLITVEIVVLAVFFSRFIIDRRNNDLTDEINVHVADLSNTYYREAEIKFTNFHTLFEELALIQEQQRINSTLVSSIIEGVPANVEMQRYVFSDGKVTMNFSADSFEAIQAYESSLRLNRLYEDVRVNLSKSGESTSKIDFAVNFSIANYSEEEVEL